MWTVIDNLTQIGLDRDMKIYRIEHLTEGVGPYAFTPEKLADIVRLNDVLNTHRCYDGDRCPVPEDDGIFAAWGDASCYKHMRYAFASLDQLFDWFQVGCVLDLLALDFVIAEYEVSESSVRKGRRHLAYDTAESYARALYDSLDFLSDKPLTS